MEEEETLEKKNEEHNCGKETNRIANCEILRMALLSAEDDTASSDLFSLDSTYDSKEFIIVAQRETDNELVGKELSNCSLPVNESKCRRLSNDKRHDKIASLRTNNNMKYEPIVEIKEEEQHSILSTDLTREERVPIVNSLMQNIDDSKDSVNWLQTFTPFPLCYHTDRGEAYLKCPACGAMFFTSNSFEKHLYCHIYKQQDSFACSFCNYTNTEAGMLFAHLSRHQDQCEFCNENLMRKNNSQHHWDITASTVPVKRDLRGRFVCTVCELVFDLLAQLEKHWLKHVCKRERIYQCKECCGFYDSRDALNSHKCMKCAVCGQAYENLHRLKAHTIWSKHNLKCPICSYEFILAMDHEKHLALHRQTYRSIKRFRHCLQADNGKTFQCDLCDKLFYDLPSLLLHLREDHNVKNVRKAESGENEEGKEETIGQILVRILKTQTANYIGEQNNITVGSDQMKL